MSDPMPNEPTTPQNDDEFWRDYLTRPDSLLRFGRRVLRHIPASPRCRLCAAPFGGFGAPVMRMIGKGPSAANPNMCTTCENVLIKYHGGAEVPGALLFADIRGSTALAEHMSPTDFRTLLDRFYSAATQAVFDHDGGVDKFVGDELVAYFFPSMAGDRYVAKAVDAARAVLHATGHADPNGPWVPVGAGVHAGTMWFGAVGEGSHVELTALGDGVNVAARLASSAAAGEVLVSDEAAVAAGLDPSLRRETLDVRGRQVPIEVVHLRVDR